MKFGLFTMPEHPPRKNWTLSDDRDIDEVVLAEKLGFEECWIGESSNDHGQVAGGVLSEQ